jgi:hypothetical protein
MPSAARLSTVRSPTSSATEVGVVVDVGGRAAVAAAAVAVVVGEVVLEVDVVVGACPRAVARLPLGRLALVRRVHRRTGQ